MSRSLSARILSAQSCSFFVPPRSTRPSSMSKVRRTVSPARPTINHCTLRKAIINANIDSRRIRNVRPAAAWTRSPSCRRTITFAIAGISEDAGTDRRSRHHRLADHHRPSRRHDHRRRDPRPHLHINPRAPGVTVTLNDLHADQRHGSGGGGGIPGERRDAEPQQRDDHRSYAIRATAARSGDHGGVLQMNNCTISGNSRAHGGGSWWRADHHHEQHDHEQHLGLRTSPAAFARSAL